MLGGTFLLLPVLLCACREQQGQEGQTLPSAMSPPRAAAADNAQAWLSATSSEAPADFLARMSGESASDIAPRLKRASSRYREAPRMIANRVIQLWQELRRNDGEAVTVARLLDEFATARSQPEHSIGPIIQHYRVLRNQGLTHQAAVVRLSGTP